MVCVKIKTQRLQLCFFDPSTTISLLPIVDSPWFNMLLLYHVTSYNSHLINNVLCCICVLQKHTIPICIPGGRAAFTHRITLNKPRLAICHRSFQLPQDKLTGLLKLDTNKHNDSCICVYRTKQGFLWCK